MIAWIFALPIVQACAAVSAILTWMYRHNLEPHCMWRPFTVFYLSVLMIIGLVAISFSIGSRPYP